MRCNPQSAAATTRWRPLVVGLWLASVTASAWSFTTTITSGTRALYLQVGVGNVSGGRYDLGGVPGDNPTVNNVTVTVPAASVGTGPVAMTTDSTVTASSWDGFNFCPALGSTVYVGGFFRAPNGGGSAVLTAQSPTSLTNGAGDSIPFNQISWVSSGAQDPTPTIPSGTFTGGTQNLYSMTRNRWFESCFAFSFANSALLPAGNYTGRVTYTLTAP